MAIRKMVQRDEIERGGGQTKSKIRPDSLAFEGPTAVGRKSRARRERRPAAVTSRLAPAYPARTPGSIRTPDPAITRVLAPPAVVERRPSPGIIGIPIPT